MTRGGSWDSSADCAISAVRRGYDPDYKRDWKGFRVAFSIPEGQEQLLDPYLSDEK